MKEKSEPKAISKLSLLSLMFGISSFLSFYALAPAVAFGFLALRQREQGQRRKFYSAAWWGIGIGVFAVSVEILALGSILLPNRITSAKAQNESNTLNAIMEIRVALAKFRNESGGYPKSLSELVQAKLLSRGRENTLMYGYQFSYVPDSGSPVGVGGKVLYSGFSLTASPENSFQGRRVFHLDQLGSIVIKESRDADALIEEVIK